MQPPSDPSHHPLMSRTAEYALRAAVYLADHQGVPVTSAVMSDAISVPRHYLSKVLRMLVAAGLITSTRGPTGGFLLNTPHQSITALDVVQAVEPLRPIDRCPLGRADHPDLCPLHRLMNATLEQMAQQLSEVTIAQLRDSFTVCPPQP